MNKLEHAAVMSCEERFAAFTNEATDWIPSKRFEKEVKLFHKLWERELEDGDPYYNPNLK